MKKTKLTEPLHPVPEVRALSKKWLNMYNNERPHESLRGLTPALFAERKQIIVAA